MVQLESHPQSAENWPQPIVAHENAGLSVVGADVVVVVEAVEASVVEVEVVVAAVEDDADDRLVELAWQSDEKSEQQLPRPTQAVSQLQVANLPPICPQPMAAQVDWRPPCVVVATVA